MGVQGLRFDRNSRGGFAVYDRGRLIGMITPEGSTTPSPDAKTLRRAAQELRARGLLGHADTRSRATRAAGTRGAGRAWRVGDFFMIPGDLGVCGASFRSSGPTRRTY